MDNHPLDQKSPLQRSAAAKIAGQLSAAIDLAFDGQIVVGTAEQEMLGEHRPDLFLTLSADGRPLEIAVEILRHGYPRDIRAAMWRLDECKRATLRPQSFLPMVVAQSLSSGAKEILRKGGIGYFESSGTLYLRWKKWFINIERPATAREKKGSSSLFTDAREMVVHALLKFKDQWVSGGELADLAQTSSYTCSVVLQELERREWLESIGGGRTLRRRLHKPGLLLDAWADEWTQRKEQLSRWYLYPNNPHQLLEQLTFNIDKTNIDFPWAFSGTAAANVFSPLLTHVDNAEIIVPPGCATEFAEALQLKPVDKGANITLLERDGASLLFRDMHPDYPAYFASPFILYMDVLDGRGRNKELAEHVREFLEV